MVGGNRSLWALRVPLEHLGARVFPDMFSPAQGRQAFDAEGHVASFEQTIRVFMDLIVEEQHFLPWTSRQIVSDSRFGDGLVSSPTTHKEADYVYAKDLGCLGGAVRAGACDCATGRVPDGNRAQPDTRGRVL